MAIASNAAKYPVRSPQREAVFFGFSFRGANGANPDVAYISDPAHLISTIVRDGEGSYVVTLKVGYYAIEAWPLVKSTQVNYRVTCDATTAATPAVIYLTCFDGGAVDDLDGVTISVLVGAQR